jgi:uncharacterized Zn-binding protein involved in type VI secretion
MRVLAVLLSLLLPMLAPDSAQAKAPPVVRFELTHPAGASPKVFTEGWIFGAKLTVNGKDYSEKVRWSGTGTFKPAVGVTSHPTFQAAGTNTITLAVTVNKQEITKSFQVDAVSPTNYVGVGDLALCSADAHSTCPGCPHSVQGPITAGSSLVQVRGKSAARKGDPGMHASCCGPNRFTILEGDPEVLIEGKPAARFGDKTKHCGGIGRIVRASEAIPEPTGASDAMKVDLLIRISGPSVINQSVSWVPGQNRSNQPSKAGPYLIKDGVQLAVKGQSFSADFTHDYDYGKAFPSQIHLEGSFNAARTAIESLSVSLKAERSSKPGSRDTRQWSLVAKGIPLTTATAKRKEYRAQGPTPQDRPKGFQLLKADYSSTSREAYTDSQGKAALSEFREDQLRAEAADVSLRVTVKLQ